MRASLRARVVAASLVAVAATLCGVLFVVSSTFAVSEHRDLDRRLLERATAAAQAAAGGARRPQAAPPPAGAGAARPPAAPEPSLARRVEQAVAQGGESARLLVGSRVLQTFGAPGPRTGFPVASRGDVIQTVHTGGGAYRTVTLVVRVRTDRGRDLRARLQLAAPLAEVDGRITDLRRQLLVIGLLGLGGAAVAALLCGRLALRALERLRGRVAGFPATDGAQLPRGGPREVDELAAAVNAMLDRLAAVGRARDDALEASRRFAADAGHELRTPLAAMAANIDTLRAHPSLPASDRDALLQALADDAIRQASLLDALQSLARAEAAQELARAPFDAGDVADAAVQAAGRRHPGRDIRLRVGDDGPGLIAWGWEDGVRLALDNLIVNAIVHGSGTVTVSVRRAAEGGGATLTVEDEGDGIPPHERAAVTARFVRGAGARGPGHGLGLALVAQQAELHGGRLDVAATRSGGARLSLWLPGVGRPSSRSESPALGVATSSSAAAVSAPAVSSAVT